MPIFAVPELIAVRDGQAVFAASGSGGYRITTAILHALAYWHDFGMSLADAVAGPRLHCQGKETYLDAAFPPRCATGWRSSVIRSWCNRTTPALTPSAGSPRSCARGKRLQAVSGPPGSAAPAGSEPECMDWSGDPVKITAA